MWQARVAAKFLIGLSGIAVLGLGIATVSPGYMILGLLIVFASVPLLARPYRSVPAKAKTTKASVQKTPSADDP